MPLDGTSQPVELLLSVTRDGDRTLGAQIEEQLRRAVRVGARRPGARLPSTRDLARQLGVSRRLAVDAYAVNRITGSFILIDDATNATAGAGLIRSS